MLENQNVDQQPKTTAWGGSKSTPVVGKNSKPIDTTRDDLANVVCLAAAHSGDSGSTGAIKRVRNDLFTTFEGKAG